MKFGSILLTYVASLASAQDDVVYVRQRSAPFAPLNTTAWNGTVPFTGRSFRAYAGVLQNADLFSIELAANGCQNHANTSVTAKQFGCQLATNAGFFDFTPPACDGNLIVNGTTVIWAQDEWANFGVGSR
jgi:hypothetical protein